MGRLINTCFLLSIFTIVFWSWFSPGPIIGGDWPYFFTETIREFRSYPESWNTVYGGGLGGVIPNYFLNQYLHLTIFPFVNILHIPWIITYKIFWFFGFLLLSSFSIRYLLSTLFPLYKTWQLVLSIVLFSANTYILMIVGGGQMGIALAYAITPFVLALFIKLIDFINAFSGQAIKGKNIRIFLNKSIFLGLAIAMQILFDPRMAYVAIIAAVIYFFLHFSYKKLLHLSLFGVFGILLPIGLSVLLHMQWILPILVFRSNPIPEGVTSSQGFLFFSFADFSHAFSLLHPNWPENIFGKTYFLRPEFLGLPLLAYASIFFIKISKQPSQKIHNRKVIFFVLLGLLGVFLSKGANPPFGEINQWFFAHIFGMNLFRDPTKFYLLITMSYAMLIPFSVFHLYEILNSKLNVTIRIKQYFQNFLIFSIIFYILLLLQPAFFGKLGGTFKKNEVPKEYIALKDILVEEKEFFRTLWVPKQSRFTFVSNMHPAIEAGPLFKATNSAEVVRKLQANGSQEYLGRLSIKYIIIPHDSLGEIFLHDRKYNDVERREVEKQMDAIPWLKKKKLGNITSYENALFYDHFKLIEDGKLSFQMINPTQYDVFVNSKEQNRLIFSEAYSSYWIAKILGNTISSDKTEDGLNSFIIPKGEYKVEIVYIQDKYYFYGRIIAIVVFILALGALGMLQSRNYAK